MFYNEVFHKIHWPQDKKYLNEVRETDSQSNMDCRNVLWLKKNAYYALPLLPLLLHLPPFSCLLSSANYPELESLLSHQKCQCVLAWFVHSYDWVLNLWHLTSLRQTDINCKWKADRSDKAENPLIISAGGQRGPFKAWSKYLAIVVQGFVVVAVLEVAVFSKAPRFVLLISGEKAERRHGAWCKQVFSGV